MEKKSLQYLIPFKSFIPRLEHVLDNVGEYGKSFIQQMHQRTFKSNESLPRCYKCKNTSYARLELVQPISTTRCSDELIETHFFL